ncbi:MAG: YqjF family protein [Planctomycetaceae bacterium]
MVRDSSHTTERLAAPQVAGRPAGYQQWSNLLFVHWRLPADRVRRLIPEPLTLDTWEGDAWVGLVPFAMSGVRPWWFPACPGISSFLETNVRTYVRLGERDPGVWFFSLDASSSLAVWVARWRWHLAYYRACMALERTCDRLWYETRRLRPSSAGPGCTIDATLGNGAGGAPESAATSAIDHALPGSLEQFLIERYILYAADARGQLYSGRVRHRPYPLRPAQIASLDENLLAAAGIGVDSGPCHVVFSEGVSVEILPLRPVASAPASPHRAP